MSPIENMHRALEQERVEHKMKVKEMMETANLLQEELQRKDAAMQKDMANMEASHREEVSKVKMVLQEQVEDVNRQLKDTRRAMVEGKGSVENTEKQKLCLSPVSHLYGNPDEGISQRYAKTLPEFKGEAPGINA